MTRKIKVIEAAAKYAADHYCIDDRGDTDELELQEAYLVGYEHGLRDALASPDSSPDASNVPASGESPAEDSGDGNN